MLSSKRPYAEEFSVKNVTGCSCLDSGLLPQCQSEMCFPKKFSSSTLKGQEGRRNDSLFLPVLGCCSAAILSGARGFLQRNQAEIAAQRSFFIYNAAYSLCGAGGTVQKVIINLMKQDK